MQKKFQLAINQKDTKRNTKKKSIGDPHLHYLTSVLKKKKIDIWAWWHTCVIPYVIF